MHSKIAHCNINVTDLDKSLAFYQEALGLAQVSRKDAADGRFSLAFLSDGQSDFRLELTFLRDHPQKYDLGENESHICFLVPDYQAAHARHEQMGCICFENPEMGLYFIEDPDGYWLEILPEKR